MGRALASRHPTTRVGLRAAARSGSGPGCGRSHLRTPTRTRSWIRGVRQAPKPRVLILRRCDIAEPPCPGARGLSQMRASAWRCGQAVPTPHTLPVSGRESPPWRTSAGPPQASAGAAPRTPPFSCQVVAPRARLFLWVDFASALTWGPSGPWGPWAFCHHACGGKSSRFTFHNSLSSITDINRLHGLEPEPATRVAAAVGRPRSSGARMLPGLRLWVRSSYRRQAASSATARGWWRSCRCHVRMTGGERENVMNARTRINANDSDPSDLNSAAGENMSLFVSKVSCL